MKLAFAVLAVLAAVGQMNAYVLPSVGSGDVAKVLQEFVSYVPLDEVAELTKTYLACDKDFQRVMRLLQSEDLKEYLADVEGSKEFKKLLNYLQENGLDAHLLWSELKESLAKEPVQLPNATECKVTFGFNGFVNDLDSLIPKYELANLFEYDVVMSEVFKNLVNEVLSTEYTDLFTSTFTNSHFQDLLHYVEKLNLDSAEFHANFLPLLVVKFYVQSYLSA